MKCKESISANLTKQGDKYFCSLERVSQAAGYVQVEELSYFEEELSKDLYNDFDE